MFGYLAWRMLTSLQCSSKEQMRSIRGSKLMLQSYGNIVAGSSSLGVTIKNKQQNNGFPDKMTSKVRTYITFLQSFTLTFMLYSKRYIFLKCLERFTLVSSGIMQCIGKSPYPRPFSEYLCVAKRLN